MVNAATYLLETVMRDLEVLTDDVPTRASIWLCIESAGHLDSPVDRKLWRGVRWTTYRYTKAYNLMSAVLKASPNSADPTCPTQSELIAGLAYATSEHRHPVNRNTNNRGA